MSEEVTAADYDATRVEEGTSSATPTAASSSKQQQTLWHRKGFRLLLLLLLIGGLIGLVVGLVTRNDDNNNNNNNSSSANDNSSSSTADADGGVENSSNTTTTTAVPPEEKADDPIVINDDRDPTDNDPPPTAISSTTPAPTAAQFQTAIPWVETATDPPTVFTPITPVLVDRSSCTYTPSQTVIVTAPRYEPLDTNGTIVRKMLSGGASSFDGENAVIVSYNGEGTAGAVWALSRTADDSDNGNDSSSWEQTGILQTNTSDQLGWGVSIKGDTFVVGAPGHEGSEVWLIDSPHWAGRGLAMVMAKRKNEKQGDGEENMGDMKDMEVSSSSSWYQQDILSPEVADDNCDFGTSVSIAECECLIAVGAWHDRDSRGSVFIFAKNKDDDDVDTNESWTEIQKLAPDNTRRSQSDHLHGNYGYTVAITDNYLAIKAPYDSYTNSYEWEDPNRGVVYVYKRNGEDGTFVQSDRLYTPEGTQVRNHLKDMIFLENGVLLVGAPGRNKVYVFERTTTSSEEGDDNDGNDGSGEYRKTAELTPSDGSTPDSFFGVSLDGKGTDVLVGDRGNQTSYLFSYEDGAWKEKAKFDGLNTALSGDTIVEHTPKTFEMMSDGKQYGGNVNFYDLVCQE